MVIELTREEEERLQAAAKATGRDVKTLMTSAALWLADLEAAYDEGLEKSITQASRGELIEHDEVGARLKARFAAQ